MRENPTHSQSLLSEGAQVGGSVTIQTVSQTTNITYVNDPAVKEETPSHPQDNTIIASSASVGLFRVRGRISQSNSGGTGSRNVGIDQGAKVDTFYLEEEYRQSGAMSNTFVAGEAKTVDVGGYLVGEEKSSLANNFPTVPGSG